MRNFYRNSYCKQSYAISYIAGLSCKLWCQTWIPALRKAVTTRGKKYEFFSRVFDIADQLLTRQSPSRHFVWLMNKRQSLHHSQSKVVCQNFFNLWLLNTKKSLPLTDSDVQTLLGEEENQNTKRKAETYIFSAFGNEIFHG